MCRNITVIDDDVFGIYTGTYMITNERASKSPNKPVFKMDGGDRYLFHYPNNNGWIISDKTALLADTNPDYFFKSKFVKLYNYTL